MKTAPPDRFLHDFRRYERLFRRLKVGEAKLYVGMDGPYATIDRLAPLSANDFARVLSEARELAHSVEAKQLTIICDTVTSNQVHATSQGCTLLDRHCTLVEGRSLLKSPGVDPGLTIRDCDEAEFSSGIEVLAGVAKRCIDYLIDVKHDVPEAARQTAAEYTDQLRRYRDHVGVLQTWLAFERTNPDTPVAFAHATQEDDIQDTLGIGIAFEPAHERLWQPLLHQARVWWSKEGKPPGPRLTTWACSSRFYTMFGVGMRVETEFEIFEVPLADSSSAGH